MTVNTDDIILDKFVISVISLAVHLYKQDFCNWNAPNGLLIQSLLFENEKNWVN